MYVEASHMRWQWSVMHTVEATAENNQSRMMFKLDEARERERERDRGRYTQRETEREIEWERERERE